MGLAVLIASPAVRAQEPVWDDTRRTLWPEGFEVVEIPSTADGTVQKAYFRRAPDRKPQPLIVSLHTWSGDYTQKDPLAAEVLARGFNYIHPDFRGANNKPGATGSPLVLSDIEDAIRYALEYSNSDPEHVHIIGVSGGGMATLAAYMNLDYPVRSFSAWAPISDLEAWYWESVGRGQKYAQDILDSVSADGEFDAEEARRRSPLYQAFPMEKRAGAQLYIYTGIHDGYTGSVPITHSIAMYNRLVREMKSGNASAAPRDDWYRRMDADLVGEDEIISLLARRFNPACDPADLLNDRAVYLRRDYKNIHLALFEGGHEMLPRALSMIPFTNRTSDLERNIVTIGDSNGANPGGWVDQLRVLLPGSAIFNISQGGRTIGFDNNGREELNALRCIDSYLDRAAEHLEGERCDYLVLCLGTNDTKAEFAGRQGEVTENFGKLLDKMVQHPFTRQSRPALVFVTPPPMGVEDMQEKYVGGNGRLAVLVPQLAEIAGKKGFTVIDVYHPLQAVFRTYAPDGVHMVPEGQEIVAQKIAGCIEQLENGD